MNIISLSAEIRGFVIVLSIISVTIIATSMITSFIHTSRKKHIAFNITAFIILSLNLASLFEINRIAATNNPDITPFFITTAINAIPHYFQYLLFVFAGIFVFYEFTSLKKYREREFSALSVKDAMENLPSGLAYCDEDGNLLLSNRIMRTLSLELTSKDLQNITELQSDLTHLQNDASCVIPGDEPAFMLPSGNVWRFSTSVFYISDMPFTKFQADNITELYHLSDELRVSNKKLVKQQQRTLKYIENIEEYIAREEMLRVKMAIHDDFGELIALTVRAYEGNFDLTKKCEILSGWSGLSDKISDIFTEGKREAHTLDSVLSFAQQLGCSIEIVGTIPHSFMPDIIWSAVFESIKNAVYHAGCEKISLEIVEKHDKIITNIVCINDKNITNISEGGGLSSLRARVEKAGGKMQIICDSNLTLKIILDKFNYVGVSYV